MAPHAEVWLRGAVPDIDPLLQPVAHSLMQSAEDVQAGLRSLEPELLWARPGTAASAGFHLVHAIGSLDRLFTYARGEGLDESQRAALEREKDPTFVMSPEDLAVAFDDAVNRALAQLRETPASDLLVARAVGRAGLPSTVIGLLFHGAEHTMRHVGQFTTTVRITRGH